MVDHAWVLENLDTYLAGDLTKLERDDLERHLAACEPCKQALAETRRLEEMMNGLFADARPSANLDDRIIQNLGKTAAPVMRRPTLWRFAGAAAAVLVIGLIGAAVQAISSEGDSPFATWKDALQKESTTMVGGKIGDKSSTGERSYFGAIKGTVEGVNGIEAREKGYADSLKVLLDQTSNDPLPSVSEDDRDIKYMTEDISVPGKVNADKAVGIRDGDKSEPPLKLPNPGFGTKGQGGALELPKWKETLDRRYDPKDDLYKANKKIEEAGYDAKSASKEIEMEKANKDVTDALAKFLDQRKESKEAPIVDLKVTRGSPPGDDAEKLKLFVPTPVTTTKLTAPGYFDTPPPPSLAPPGPVPVGPIPEGEDKRNDGKKDGGGKSKGPPNPTPKVEEGKQPDGETPAAPKTEPKKLPPDEPPLETNRKIIRTGEMEFEIASFDKSVDNITLIITNVKGGFIATINSDKLPNGKMKGSIVVRMPPQYLDKFVLDLRRKLTESGELKNQRIVSLDVTKQYTDIESRVRAARTMEERLIQIIKIGKGEIKDLIAAERELGIWRTKIEEMEGEIRYYSNQVSLSTLTIQLYEKEILAPTAIVVSESVRMRLEVDDVAKAHKTAMDLVEELKGTITKSELKQHTAGQLQSILQADIPPGKKDVFRDALKKLGIVSSHEENQSQHTEGGIGKGAQLKARQDDVHFDVTMHNTVNIAPARAADLKIATIDVPSTKKAAIDSVLANLGTTLERTNVRAQISQLSTERKFGYTVTLRDFASIAPSKAVVEVIAAVNVPIAYEKLQAAIVLAKGHVAAAQMDELDKLHVNARIEFSVFVEEKKAIDAVLKDLGVSLSRNNAQAPMNQLSTAKKFGYVVMLRDFAGIPASKSVVEVIAAVDVPIAYARLQEAITQAKGQIADAKMNELDKLNVVAQIEFSVFIEDKKTIDDVLNAKDFGISLSKTNVQAPMNQLSTAKKFGYVLLLRDYANVPATKFAELSIAVTDVPKTFAKLVKAIENAKGKADAKLNEKDKLDITARLVFTVPADAKAAMDDFLLALGNVLTRQEMPVPANQLATDKKYGYMVDLRDFAAIAPSQFAAMTIATSHVPDKFAKLIAAVNKVKGQIRTAKLNEQDKLNVTGQINFVIPSEDKATFEKMLLDMGSILSRSDEQTPATVQSTDRKFGYGVELRDFANIRARETFIVQIAMNDVPATFQKFQAAVIQAKGWVSVGKLVEDNKAKIEAQFDFDVPASEKGAIERLLAKPGGAVISRTSSQVAANELATDQKVGYRLKLRSTASILPREIVSLKFEVKDVDAKVTELKDIVIAANGRVVGSSVERSENGQSTAVLVLDVPFAKQDEVIRRMKGIASLVSQKSERNPQIQENELTTSRLLVSLTGSNPIVPPDEGISSSVNKSLYLSFRILMGIFMALVVGLSAIVPCVILIWIGLKAYAILASSSPPAPSLAPAGSGSKLIAEDEKPGDGDSTAKA